MATCKGFLTTAGFESIGEAMYHGKTIHMIPVKGQYEQHCNALNAEKAGAGKEFTTFDLKVLKNYMDNLHDNQLKDNPFKAWQNSLESHVLEMINEISCEEKVAAY